MDISWEDVIKLVIFAGGTFYLRATGKKDSADVKIATSSHEQVTRLETRVMGLQNQVTQLNDKISKVLPPDDRGPS